MEIDKERMLVIQNIKNAANSNNLNSKVELADPVVTDKQRERKILNFDNQRVKLKNKILEKIAVKYTQSATQKINVNTKIIGMENLKNLKGGAIITCNHFNPEDNTVIRYMTQKLNPNKKLYIVIQEANVFMNGIFGFLMRNCDTLPVSKSVKYMQNNLYPAMRKILEKENYILIYPEKEMWYNYKKPRKLQNGAYHYAIELGVPIIPCFIQMESTDTILENGLYKQDYILHIMEPIYPDRTKDLHTNIKEMKEKDYYLKVKIYEDSYRKKLDYQFNESDIAGFLKR